MRCGREGLIRDRRTCDGVVVLWRAEEEAVGLADLGAEGLDGGREAGAAVGLEVGVDERQVGDVEVVDAQARDGVLAHLRGCQGRFSRRRQSRTATDREQRGAGSVPARRRPLLKEALRREPQMAATRRTGFAAAASMLGGSGVGLECLALPRCAC